MKRKGLTIIAPEVQGSSKEAIEEMVKDKKLDYTITKGISGPSLSRGIPHMAVFDVEGKLIFSGHPMSPDAEKTIKAALKEATPPDQRPSSGPPPKKQDLVAQREWTNAEGKSITAVLVEVVGTTGHFKFPNGRKFEYDVAKLSEPDQELIKKAVEQTSEAE